MYGLPTSFPLCPSSHEIIELALISFVIKQEKCLPRLYLYPKRTSQLSIFAIVNKTKFDLVYLRMWDLANAHTLIGGITRVVGIKKAVIQNKNRSFCWSLPSFLFLEKVYKVTLIIYPSQKTGLENIFILV